jgi:microcompartment protein CcmL/EutN
VLVSISGEVAEVAAAAEAAATLAATTVVTTAEFATDVFIQRLFVGLLDLPLKFSKYYS